MVAANRLALKHTEERLARQGRRDPVNLRRLRANGSVVNSLEARTPRLNINTKPGIHHDSENNYPKADGTTEPQAFALHLNLQITGGCKASGGFTG